MSHEEYFSRYYEQQATSFLDHIGVPGCDGQSVAYRLYTFRDRFRWLGIAPDQDTADDLHHFHVRCDELGAPPGSLRDRLEWLEGRIVNDRVRLATKVLAEELG